MEAQKKVLDIEQFDNNVRISLYLMIFVIGGVFGFIYEELFYRIDMGCFVKRGTTYGPWIPIYGFGAVLITRITNKYRENPLVTFLLAAIISGILEFTTGYVLFHSMGLRLWDYNVEIWNWLNVGGYICFRSILFFGISALALQYLVYPLLIKIIQKYRTEKVMLVSYVLAGMFLYDILISVIYGRKF
ncbi:MAG: putative ABC transporter permease [Roseburia sp.]